MCGGGGGGGGGGGRREVREGEKEVGKRGVEGRREVIKQDVGD